MAVTRFRSIVLFSLLILASLASGAKAQVVAPGWSGGNAIARSETTTASGLRTWQLRDLAFLWSAPRWLPGRSPLGGSLGAARARPERRTWLRSRLP